MIAEWLIHTFTPAPKWVKEMGYLRESIAILSRYQRCSKQWDEHLGKCKKFILECVNKSDPKSILILGSGHLLDIPFKDLQSRVDSLFLVDIFHPSKVHSLSKKYSNVHFIESDLTQVGHFIWEKTQKKDSSFEDFFKVAQPTLPSVDLVISINLLSQLPLGIIEYIKKKKKFSDAQFLKLEKHIQQQHLDLLKMISKKACIITDIERNIFYKNNQLIEHDTLVTRDMLPVSNAEWIWEIEPRGEIDFKKYGTRKVEAFFI
jgi:hypothetical protein